MPEARRSRLDDLREVASLVRTRLRAREMRERDAAGHRLLVRFAAWAQPGYIPTKATKTWLSDSDFFREYDRLMPADRRRSAERKYFLRSLLALADGLPGDTAECGVYTGASSWFICRHFEGAGKIHHGFDSFQGLPAPSAVDGDYWRRGDATAGEEQARETLAGFDVELYRGWIPERFGEIADRRFCFVHVDVDLYKPTRDSIEFFHPRLVPGGLMLFDDYGSGPQSPGAARAIDECLAGHPEPLIQSPTAQAFILKG